ISGAGIAGLTVAYWLRRYGFTPTIVVRAPSLLTGGYKIDVRGTALQARSISKAITIGGASTPPSATSPHSRQRRNPRNPVSTFPGEGHLVGARGSRSVRRSGLRWRPVVDAACRAAHQRGAIAVGQFRQAECVDPLCVGEQFDRTGPVGAPQAAVEAKGVEDAAERIPNVPIRERIVRECAGAGNLDDYVGISR